MRLITTVSKRISLFLCQKNIIASEDADIYQYGFEILISTILSTLIVLGIGIVLKMVPLSILYCVVFSTLRQMTGGYHADTYFKCNLSFGILSFCVLALTKFLSHETLYSWGIHLLILLFAALVIIVYAPVENPNKPLDDEEKKKNRIFAIAASLLLSAVSCICIKNHYIISILIGLTLFLVAMLILIMKIRRKEGET